MITPIYSTALISPGEGSNNSLYLFGTAQNQCGLGFHRALTHAETNVLEASWLRFGPRYKILLMSWDIFDASAESERPVDKSGWHKLPLPLECRPAGLLLYGTLRVFLDAQTCLSPVPLTAGIPYGSLTDDLLLRGGILFGGMQAPQISGDAGFAVQLTTRSGYRPLTPVGIRVCVHLDDGVTPG